MTRKTLNNSRQVNSNLLSYQPHMTTPSPTNKISKQIKSHKKSRTGCKICKERRVKCDEVKPKCSNCVIRNEECLYLKPDKITRNRVRKEPQYRSIGIQTDNYIELTHTPTSSSSSSTSSSSNIFSSLGSSSTTTSAESLVIVDENMFSATRLRNMPFQLQSFSPNSGSTDEQGTFLEVARLNNKLLEFYNFHYFRSISTDPALQIVWKEAGWLILKYDFLFHIVASNLFLHFYYECISGGTNQEKYLDLPNLKDYLIYSKFNHNSYVKLKQPNVFENPESFTNPTDSFTDMYGYIIGNVFDVLNIFMSPNRGILDPIFWNNLKQVAKLLINSHGKAEGIIPNDTDLLFYLKEFSINSDDGFQLQPTYLYGLCDLVEDKSQRNLLQKTIEILCKEYLKVSQTSDPLQLLLSFGMRCDEEFPKLLALHDPIALIVVSHYLMFIYTVDLKILPRFCIKEEFKKIELMLSNHRLSSWLDLPRRIIYVK